MSETTRNSPLDICRVLAIGLLADGKVDDREVEALIDMHVGKALGVTPEAFREVMQRLCKDAMFDSEGRPNLSSTDLSAISEMTYLLGRNTPADREAVKRLVDLIDQEAPDLISTQLADENRLNTILDRITDPRLQLWTSCVLVRLVSADGAADTREKRLLQHVFQRWGISPDTLAA